MSLSSLVSRIVPAAIGYATGGPVGAFTATVATEKAKSEEKKIRSEQNRIIEENRKRENLNMALPPIVTAPPRPPASVKYASVTIDPIQGYEMIFNNPSGIYPGLPTN